MAINLATKYSDQIAEVFTRASFIKGKTAETFDLTGVKTLKVYTPITVEEVDYDRDGGPQALRRRDRNAGRGAGTDHDAGQGVHADDRQGQQPRPEPGQERCRHAAPCS